MPQWWRARWEKLRRGVVDEGCGGGEGRRGRSVNHARGGLAVDYKRSFCCVVSRCLTRREGGRCPLGMGRSLIKFFTQKFVGLGASVGFVAVGGSMKNRRKWPAVFATRYQPPRATPLMLTADN